MNPDLRAIEAAILSEPYDPANLSPEAASVVLPLVQRVVRERDDLRAALEEARLTLAAEQGDIRGAPKGWARTGWLWWCPLGAKDCQAEVRRSNTHPDGEPWKWALYTPTLSAEGYAPYAREAMKRADKAFQEKA